jgi:hypothetical protein
VRVTVRAGDPDGRPDRNIIPDPALLLQLTLSAALTDLNEDAMATKQQGQIVETPTEARQGEPGPSVFALLTISTGLAVLILGIIWFAFFRV